MNRRKILKLSVLSLLVVGIGLLFLSFASSFLPSDKAVSAFPRLDLTEIRKGQYKYLPHPSLGTVRSFRWGILIYRKSDGSIKIWDIPMKDQHSVGMPDRHWWQPSDVCKNFAPTMVDNVIDESQSIKCHDSKLAVKRWQWSIDGKSLGVMLEDLRKTQGFIQGNEFVFLNNR